MKKLSFITLAAVVMSFTACGGKTSANADPDSLFYDDTVAVEEVTHTAAEAANDIVAQLNEQLLEADAEKVNGIAQTISDKVTELLKLDDIEGVETYAAIVSNFVAENAEKLKEAGAAQTITQALTSVQGIPADVVQNATQAIEGVKTAALTSAVSAIAKGESVTEAVREAATQAIANSTEDAAQAAAAAEAAKQAVEATPEAVKEAVKAKVEESKENAKQQATDAANKAIDDAAAAAKKKLGL